ncbi:MAG: SLOG family protein [Clostridiales bacterium]|nr:SLOG family protein [Clostridiales bacterium]
MKIAVIGSRSIKHADLSPFIPADAELIISGGAFGIDRIAEQYARTRGIPIKIIRPDYALHGRSAPLIRNRTIAEECDLLIAFWDGVSRGTVFTIRYARKIGKEVRLYRIQPTDGD